MYYVIPLSLSFLSFSCILLISLTIIFVTKFYVIIYIEYFIIVRDIGVRIPRLWLPSGISRQTTNSWKYK